MVYDWETHRETLSRLYVDEKRSVEDIISYMRTNHNFAPSKRAYQAQFRRWEFPSKHQPALKNDQLVARIKELWERNLSQAEMLHVLNEEDGYSIKSRELNRVRSKHRWLLRVPTGKAADGADLSPSAGASNGEDDQDNDELHMAMQASAFGLPAVPDLASQLKEERRRKMQAESVQRWATKKRRRRTRQYAGIPADPPGPPRFPSETTLGESQVILGLDKSAYTAVRDKFQSICAGAGITKKTVAGPEAWEAAKQSLIGEFQQLRDALWAGKDGLDRKKLALDVVCSDVTKRMRSGADRELLLADAKNILGLNPEDSRRVRSAFYKILQADGFTSKVAMGPQRWTELKQRWIDGSDMLRGILSRLDDGAQGHEMKTRAVEALARDVMKRLRDDQSRGRGQPRQGRARSSEALAAAAEDFRGDPPPVMGDLAGDASGFGAQMLVPPGAGDGPHGHAHAGRLIPDHHHLLGAQMGLQVPMGSDLGPSMLLGPGAQDPFANPHGQFLGGPPPMDVPSPFDPSPQPAPPPPVVYHHQAGPVAHNTGPIPVYIQLLSPGQQGVGEFSIAILNSPSAGELRQAAEGRVPGSACVRIQGLVKLQGMDGSVPLEIESDDHVAAYLAQARVPSFNIHLEF
ncbi:hypothetical protein KVR01_013150 [Diaporthe batatas]|uniref:uncharacterized protein n=1 Tax=Diaporthe batatas TaxID=748121 RepID=UPI001D04FCB6|nr:uncharacterized protein KVR01_013150 [Diaporthe batatas]KAG8156928.1 hypothetical protein KVR01_013150 [Diaporthe batatas]